MKTDLLSDSLLGDAEVFWLGQKARRFIAALVTDAARFHAADTGRRISFRSEAFTLFELGNLFATSGSRTTTFVPCAERRAYFPRSPFEKSYSPSIPFCVGLLDFFIKLALSPAGSPRANDANIVASVGVNDNEQFAVKRCTHCDVAPLHVRMFQIRNGERQGIAENSRRFFEGDAVFGEI